MSKVNYWIKRPDGKRKSFSITSCTQRGSKKSHKTIKDSRIERINKQYREGTISLESAEMHLGEIITELYKKGATQGMVLRFSDISKENQKVLNKFWANEYEARFLRDPDSMKSDFERALKYLGGVSIVAGSEAQIQKQLKKNCKTINQHRRAVARLNQILKFLGKKERLKKPKEGFKEVKHLTYDELKHVLAKIEDPNLRDLVMVLFGSGLRLGEACALKPSDFRDGVISVTKQVLRNGEVDLPKREKKGKVAVCSFALKSVESWIKNDNKEYYRNILFKKLKKITQELFPSNKNKHIGAHDLRHSHAIFLLGKGATITQVSLNLRNRIEVCQKYYTGFAHSDETINSLKKRL